MDWMVLWYFLDLSVFILVTSLAVVTFRVLIAAFRLPPSLALRRPTADERRVRLGRIFLCAMADGRLPTEREIQRAYRPTLSEVE